MKKLFATVATMSGFTALLLTVLAGPAYRFELLDLRQAFTLLQYGALVGLISPPLIIFYSLTHKPQGRLVSVLAVSAVVGLFSFYVPFSQWQDARSAPPIHDISTDLENPPEFVAVRPLRADAPNPAEHPGEEVAQQQREAYPDIGPMNLGYSMEEVFEAVQVTVRQRGWALVAAEREEHEARVEATNTTLWFGFKDDLVIRLQTVEEGVRVDVRSKSRVATRDGGANAERIEAFTERLSQTLTQTD